MIYVFTCSYMYHYHLDIDDQLSGLYAKNETFCSQQLFIQKACKILHFGSMLNVNQVRVLCSLLTII